MNSLMKEIYETRRVRDSQGNLLNAFPTSLDYEIAVFLYELIQNESLDVTLEVGMAYGLSTLSICQAHQDKGRGTHTAIDPFQSKSWKSIGLLNIKRSGLEDRLRFFESYSHEILPQLLQKEEKLDFALIDGSHLFDYAFVDFFYIDKLLKLGGYITFDDIWMPAIKKVVNFVLKNKSYKLFNVLTTTQLSPFKGALKLARHLSQNSLHDPLDPVHAVGQACTVQKVHKDSRPWNFHRSF